ncbi:glycosyltransferase family 2 [Haloferula helveola]|uniref:Glycosyltransferase family 2 n=2 Tax=Haloferula helveola TaxID=490095 RepID=A0ABM7RDC4_9BACT|nr:glycosyltransferase family 2 [Haloferula helveola]
MVDGRFFRLGDERVFLQLITYGPLPGGWPEDFEGDFKRIAATGADAIRLYQHAPRRLLDAAKSCGLRVFQGLEWPHACDFLGNGGIAPGLRAMEDACIENGHHPALAGVFVANEVPADLVRWMGAERVREALEALIHSGKERWPHLLWAYANYPSTEYLEPGNADFTAMNVYLEREPDFRAYLRRLHHVAGDRPLMVSEFGLDSMRNGEERQAEALGWGIRACRELGTAGVAAYAWSDRWWNAGAEVKDWSFGLIDRQGEAKPALGAVTEAFAADPEPVPETSAFSVIVCCRDGRERIGRCLESLRMLNGPEPEVIVVDDGSTDGTGELVETRFPEVRLVRLEAGGLSAARNAGAAAASREIVAFTDDDCEVDPDWLIELGHCFESGWDAVGGPNLPPPPSNAFEAVIASAPGAASHVMLDDLEAEHVPGCNLAVRRTTYFAIGGFDPAFRTAGDDVDFCWRLRDAGMRIGFAPNGFVWHHRRPCASGYLRQQIGYGKAEALLMRKHPRRFSPSGDAIWKGVIYGGGPVRVEGEAVIYHGSMGMAGYQGVITRMQPLRPLFGRFDRPACRLLLKLLTWIAPRLRSQARIGRFRGPLPPQGTLTETPDAELAIYVSGGRESVLRKLLDLGWEAGGPTDGWDVQKDGTRVLVACEHFDDGASRLRIRVWGDGSRLPDFDSIGA